MQEANNKVEEVEEKMRNLKEELEMIRYKKNVFCSA
jgi:archaellum component FlaC